MYFWRLCHHGWDNDDDYHCGCYDSHDNYQDIDDDDDGGGGGGEVRSQLDKVIPRCVVGLR